MASSSSASPGGAAGASSNATALTFNNIRANTLPEPGHFRLLNEKFGWRVRKLPSGETPNRKTIQYEARQVEAASWIVLNAKESRFKVVLKDGEIAWFDGFKDSDFPAIQKHVAEFWKLPTVPRNKVASKGWHWGEGKLEGGSFNFLVDGRVAFDLAAQRVKQVSASKGDVILVLDDDPQRAEAEDQLLELRLFVPPPKSGEEDAAEGLKEAFFSLAASRSTPLVQDICTLADLKVLVPAGRFDLHINRQSIKLQGKSADFTIEFSSITKMYLLHSSSSPHVFLVLSLAAPLRKGHTPYFNVVVQFDEKKMVEAELGLTEEEIKTIESANNPSLNTNLTKSMTGNQHDIVSRILKAMSGKPMVLSGEFKSSTGQSCFRSSFKAESGIFYPLNKSFIFIPKPVIIVKYEDITTVTFGRASGSQTKLFEFEVVTKGGPTYSFSSVDRQESGPLMQFLQSRDIRVRAFGPDDANEEENGLLRNQDLPSEDESDDEDFQAELSEEEEESFDEDEDEEADEKVE